MIAVLDTQGVEVLADRRRQLRARLRVLLRHADDIVIPAAVLAEGVLTGKPDHDVGVHRLLRDASIVDVDGSLGLAAGALRHRALVGRGAPPSGIDAIVAAIADRRASTKEVVIVTSDADDLLALTRVASNPDRLSIARV